MKKLLIIFILINSCFTICAQTEKDSMVIKRACLDYIEGWATGDVNRITRAVSKELVKRTIVEKDSVFYIRNMGASQLVYLTKRNGINGVRLKDLEPDTEFKSSVVIFDISGKFALVKIKNTKYGFFDYCQLAKINGAWKIINVLYAFTKE